MTPGTRKMFDLVASLPEQLTASGNLAGLVWQRQRPDHMLSCYPRYHASFTENRQEERLSCISGHLHSGLCHVLVVFPA